MNTVLMSPTIGELSGALAKAQLQFKPIPKRGKNPYFNSKYALLEDIIEATRPALSENGLAVSQIATSNEMMAGVTTILLHASGEWIRGNLLLHPKDPTAQGFGGCITYARRYALAAILNVDSETDDDGNSASLGAESSEVGKGWAKVHTPETPKVNRPQDYAVTFGKHKGKKLIEMSHQDIEGYIDWLKKSAAKDNKPLSPSAKEFITAAVSYLEASETSIRENKSPGRIPLPNDDDIPF